MNEKERVLLQELQALLARHGVEIREDAVYGDDGEFVGHDVELVGNGVHVTVGKDMFNELGSSRKRL